MWLMFVAALAADVSEPTMPDWLAGCWVSQSGDSWTEECWTAPRGGIMLGSGRSMRGEVLRDWEVMQIMLDQRNGDAHGAKMAFYGAPGGLNRTMFAWTASDAPGVTFVNAAHDYPQRIRYWREGEELVAEVALKDGSKARRWRYKRPN